MSDMFESAKRAAGAMMGRAAWEAEKSQRIAALERELGLLTKERSALIEQLAAVVADLGKRGELTQPALKALGERLVNLNDEVSRSQTAIKTIQSEKYQPGAVTFSPAAGPSKSCPSCGAHMPLNSRFCASCGARLA
jgi:uncharacterized coiled-coil protein SlyX